MRSAIHAESNLGSENNEDDIKTKIFRDDDEGWCRHHVHRNLCRHEHRLAQLVGAVELPQRAGVVGKYRKDGCSVATSEFGGDGPRRLSQVVSRATVRALDRSFTTLDLSIAPGELPCSHSH